MSGVTITRQQELERARKMLDGWIEAEKALMTSQSYKLDTKQELTRADLRAVRESIKYWTDEIDRLQRKSRIRVQQVVPRDM